MKFYVHDLNYAIEHNEEDEFLKSESVNLECLFDISWLADSDDYCISYFEGVENILSKYGLERVIFLIASTLEKYRNSIFNSVSDCNRNWIESFNSPKQNLSIPDISLPKVDRFISYLRAVCAQKRSF